MKEYEIMRSGILYYAVEKGEHKSFNDMFYDNINDAYTKTMEYLRGLGGTFLLTVPAELYD